MSLELNSMRNLKRPGLTGSFGSSKRTVGTSSQATKNLANSSAATKTTHFSFKSSNKHNWVAGQNVSKGQNRYNYQGMRASLNSRTFTPSVGYSGPTTYGTTTYTVNNNNAYMKGQIIGQVLNGTFSLLNQLGVFDGLKGDGAGVKETASGKLDKAMDSLGTVPTASTVTSGTASAAISSMSSANDSASLRSAIASASNDLSTMDMQTGTLEANAIAAQNNKETLETNVSNAEKDVTDKKQALSTANNKVKTLQDKRDNYQVKLENANKAYGEATDTYTKACEAHTQAKAETASAKQGLADAEAALNACPNDAEHAAQRAQLQSAVNAAKERLQQAEQNEKAAANKEKEALEAKEKAYAELGDAKKAVDEVKTQLEDAQSKLDKAKEEQTQAEKDLKTSEANLEKAKQELSNADGAIQKFKEHKEDIKELQDAIEKQQKRLEKLEQEEVKKYDKLTNKINNGVAANENRLEDINPEDGMNVVEKMKSRITEQTNLKNQERLAKKDSLQSNYDDITYKNSLLKQSPDFTLGSSQYRAGQAPSGQTLYYRDNQPISEEEYEQARKAVGVSA